MEGRVEMTVSRVHQTKQTVDWDENLLNRDTEEEEGEGDSNESVEHAEQFARSTERSLLPISNGGDHSSREEEWLSEAPVGDVLGLQGDSSLAVSGHRWYVLIKSWLWNRFCNKKLVSVAL